MILKKTLHQIYVFFLLILFLAIAYWPALRGYYVYHDDVLFFLRTPLRIEPPSTLFTIAIGRFLSAHLLIVLAAFVKSVSYLNVLRIFSVLQLGLCGIFLYRWLRNISLDTRNAFLISLIVFLLPPFEILAVHASMSFYPLSVLFALGAGFAANKMPAVSSLKRKILNGNFILSIFLFSCALSVFQPGAMFFWALLGAIVLFSKEEARSLLQRVINFFVVGFTSLGIYAVLLKILKQYFSKFNLYAYNPYAFSLDIVGKITWFFKEAVSSSLNLWNIFPTQAMTIAAYFFIGGGLAVAFIIKAREKSLDIKEGFLKISTIFICLFLSFLPNLVPQKNVFSYRCLLGLSPLIVFIFVWALQRYAKLLGEKAKEFSTVVLLVVGILGIFLAYQNVKIYRVDPSVKEFSFFKEALQKNNINRFVRIYVVQPREEKLKKREDEFGSLTTVYSHDMIGLLSCALREIAKDQLDIYHIVYDPQNKTARFIFTDKKNKNLKSSYQVIIDSGVEKKTFADFLDPTLIVDMSLFENL